MKIGIASDHNGVELKSELIKHFKDLMIDYGPNEEGSVDYPKYAKIIAEKVLSKEIEYGVLICGTGIGMCIVANKIKGIRCGNLETKEEAFLSRSHNNANILSIRKDLPLKQAIEVIETFKNTPFSNEERHIRRVNQIENLEK